MNGPRQDPHEMDWETFDDLAGAYGADLRRWPPGQRLAAEALMRRDRARADAVMARERRLDLMLAQAAAPTPSEPLRRAVLAAAPTRRRGRSLFAPAGAAGPGIGAGVLGWTTRSIAAQPVLSGAAAAAMCAGLLCGVLLTRSFEQSARRDARQDALATAVQSEASLVGDALEQGPL